jgi:predicted RNA-binding Zn ribbon-like protein
MKPATARISTNRRRSLDAEELAIRFVNTMAWRLRKPSERLNSPDALLEWLRRNRIAASRELDQLARSWRARPSDAAAFHDTAIRLREAIYTLLTARIRGSRPSQDALSFFSDFLARACRGLRLDWKGGGLAWRVEALRASPADLLGPIALSAAELMTGARAPNVRQCQDDDGCGWLFVDESRLQNRRWCSMGDCGNRAKARRHRERARRKTSPNSQRSANDDTR